jgi:RNAse (barnase) inhibitor barstar
MSAKSKSAVIRKLTGVAQTDLPLDVIEEIVDRLAWRLIVIDGAEVVDKETFLEQCALVFGLPEWFGMNWDALEECLSELELDTPGLVVLWSSWSEMARAKPEDFAVAVDILRIAARTWAEDDVKGGVLLCGSGPELQALDL